MTDLPDTNTSAANALPVAPRTREGWEEIMVDLGFRWRWNVRTNAVEVSENSGEWERVTDLRMDYIADEVAACYAGQPAPSARQDQPTAPWRVSDRAWERILNSHLYLRQVDPFKLWLEGLPMWDGQTRLKNLVVDSWLNAVSKDALAEWASYAIVMGPIQRTYEPGCELHEIPVLIGNQKCGKSSLLKALAPPPWYSNRLNLSARDDRRREQLGQAALVEISEMAGRNRADIEELKSYLSADVDIVRLPYHRAVSELPRRCAFVATSNDVKSLPNDSTGNRRFVAIPVTKGNRGAAKWMTSEEREQIWAEGLERYMEGGRANLPESLESAQSARNEDHRDKDEDLEESVAMLAPMFKDGVTPSVLIDELHNRFPKHQKVTSRGLAKVLTATGWVSKKSGSVRSWTPPMPDNRLDDGYTEEHNTRKDLV